MGTSKNLNYVNLPYLFKYKSHPHDWHENQGIIFLNIIPSLQSHNKKLKTIKVITDVTVLK